MNVYPPLKIGAPIYVASRASVPERPAVWRRLRDVESWPIVSTWIDEAGAGETDDMSELWMRIHQEIIASEGLILLAYKSDFPLKGAFVEAGIAIGLGLPVAVILPDVTPDPTNMAPIGSWVRHPNVQICAGLGSARKYINNFKQARVVDRCPVCDHAGGMIYSPAKNAVWCIHCDAEFISTKDALTRTNNVMFDC